MNINTDSYPSLIKHHQLSSTTLQRFFVRFRPYNNITNNYYHLSSTIV